MTHTHNGSVISYLVHTPSQHSFCPPSSSVCFPLTHWLDVPQAPSDMFLSSGSVTCSLIWGPIGSLAIGIHLISSHTCTHESPVEVLIPCVILSYCIRFPDFLRYWLGHHTLQCHTCTHQTSSGSLDPSYCVILLCLVSRCWSLILCLHLPDTPSLLQFSLISFIFPSTTLSLHCHDTMSMLLLHHHCMVIALVWHHSDTILTSSSYCHCTTMTSFLHH